MTLRPNHYLHIGFVLIALYSGVALSECSAPVENFYGMKLTTCQLEVEKSRSLFMLTKAMAGHQTPDSLSAYQQGTNCQKDLKKAAESDFNGLKACMKKAHNSEGLRALAEFYAAWKIFVDSLVDYGTDEDYDETIKRNRNESNKKYHVLDALS